MTADRFLLVEDVHCDLVDRSTEGVEFRLGDSNVSVSLFFENQYAFFLAVGYQKRGVSGYQDVAAELIFFEALPEPRNEF